TLSGCLEPTSASGFFTRLLVQAARAMTRTRARTGMVRRYITYLSGTVGEQPWSPGEPPRQLPTICTVYRMDAGNSTRRGPYFVARRAECFKACNYTMPHS